MSPKVSRNESLSSANDSNRSLTELLSLTVSKLEPSSERIIALGNNLSMALPTLQKKEYSVSTIQKQYDDLNEKLKELTRTWSEVIPQKLDEENTINEILSCLDKEALLPCQSFASKVKKSRWRRGKNYLRMTKLKWRIKVFTFSATSYPKLNIFQHCVDFWPIDAIMQPKWSLIGSYAFKTR